MKDTQQNDPAEIYNWIKNTVLENPTVDSFGIKVNISISQTLEDFLEESNWDVWDWMILLLAIEVKFRIIIPEYDVENRNITFSEFATMLSQLSVIKDSGHPYERIKWLGDMMFEIYSDSMGESDEPNTIESLD